MSKTYDIVAADVGSDLKNLSTVQSLLTKGFCVVKSSIDDEQMSKALEDIKEMDGMGKFSTPPQLIYEGLFGLEGSARIAELDTPGDLSTDGDTIQELDGLMTSMATDMVELLGEMGVDCPERTLGTVHETTGNLMDIPELDLDQASLWLNTFTRHKVMIVIVLGPGKGTLTLKPYDDDAEAVELDTTPGDIIILRPDLVSSKHFSHGTVNLLTAYMLEPRLLDRHHSAQQVHSMCPPAQALDAWALAKLEDLKSQEKGLECRHDLPDDWTRAMNTITYSGQRVAVRSATVRASPVWSAEKQVMGYLAGADIVTEVPKRRFDIDPWYNPDPECWRVNQTFTRHCAFMDGIDLFDNKFFGLSPAEATGMDPMQNHFLEAGYETLKDAGYNKKKIMNSWAGVYLGTESADWGQVDKPLTAASGTGGAASITANRFSFCLGLKGPSIAFSSGGASGLVGIHTGAEGVLDKGRGAINLYSLCGGVFFSYTAIFWAGYQAADLLSGTGRCWSFADCADGFIMQDAIGVCCLERLTEKVEGVDVWVDDKPLLGIIAGSRCSNNGAASSMQAPSAMAEQELLTETCKQSGVTPLDIDALECNAEADLLKDAIEVGSAMRSLRFRQDVDQPLALSGVKANVGFGKEAAGAVAFIKTLWIQNYGCIAPQIHICELNPHMEFDDFSSMGTELMDQRANSSYHGCSSYSYGGTLAHTITWGQLSTHRHPTPPPEWAREKLVFWPGGGGELDEEVMPKTRNGYQIAGTFSRWEPVEMESSAQGTYEYTMTLGENRWESFQIYLDGNKEKILHPAAPKAHKGSTMVGPTDSVNSEGMYWLIDGRFSPEYGGLDEGKIGDKYLITVKIAGKYRTVDWVKLEAEAGAVAEKVPQGTYSIAGSWNGWSMQEMFRDDSQPDVHYVEVTRADLPQFAEKLYFQIVRNEDWEQTLYPDRPEADSSADVLGPDDAGEDIFWAIPTRELPVKIELKRSSEDGSDTKSVTWKTV